MDLRYPIGKYEPTDVLTPAQRAAAIAQIAATPPGLREAVAGLSREQLDTPYRPGGWTVRQVVHHLPDSHMNSFIRFKLALTEDEPTIKPYDEALWANLNDARDTPVEVSLTLLESLHQRMDILLRGMGPAECARKLRHPERGPMTLDDMLGLYAWHGPHHIAHITVLRERQGWEIGSSAGILPAHLFLNREQQMFSALRYYWITAKGYRLRPWASPYLRWRLETFLGGDMHSLGPGKFFGIMWRERAHFRFSPGQWNRREAQQGTAFIWR